MAAAAAVALALFSPNPAFAADLANGKQIFEGNCAACHAGGQNVIQAEKTLEKDALTESNSIKDYMKLVTCRCRNLKEER